MKKSIGYALLAFVVITLGFAFVQERRSASQADAAPQAPADDRSPDAGTRTPAAAAKPSAKAGSVPKKRPVARGTVIARYCHGHARCSNCIKIEQYSREAIETGLRKDIDSGRLRFEVVNIDEPAHRHYVQDYGLYTKSLVLISEAGGKELRHKVLNDVWNHLNDKDAFMAYVRAETEGFLR
jgi:hypothetical protein